MFASASTTRTSISHGYGVSDDRGTLIGQFGRLVSIYYRKHSSGGLMQSSGHEGASTRYLCRAMGRSLIPFPPTPEQTKCIRKHDSTADSNVCCRWPVFGLSL